MVRQAKSGSLPNTIHANDNGLEAYRDALCGEEEVEAGCQSSPDYRGLACDVEWAHLFQTD
jgi:hypothetical protein